MMYTNSDSFSFPNHLLCWYISDPWEVRSGGQTLQWGHHQQVTTLDVDNDRMAVYTQGKAVFVMAGARVTVSVGVDSKGHLEIYHFAMGSHLLNNAGGFIGK